MNRWDQMQHEISVWATHNFGSNPVWQPMLGIVEEIGEFFAASEARGDYQKLNLRDAWIDALGDQAIYMLNLCDKSGVQFGTDIAAHDENQAQPVTDRQLFGSIALACRGVLKHEQGIRGMDFTKRRTHVLMGVSMWYRWAQYQCKLLALPEMFDIADLTWDQVKRRDWKANPLNANEVAS